MLSIYDGLVIFNPIWVTLLALIGLIWLLSWTGLWTRYGYRILATLLALYALDAVKARDVIVKAMLGDQPLPLNRGSRPIELGPNRAAPT